jgi:vitamin B12 transporter
MCIGWSGAGWAEDKTVEAEGKPAEAEDHTPGSDDQPIKTEEVVISATKTPVPVSHLTSAVEVITEERLKQEKFKTVADALRFAQGLTMFSNGGPGTTASVQIRGSSTSQVLVLIDGAIVNSATAGGYDFANLTTDNIERIEILRGAQSMLWGSDAMGGVINIITKKGEGAPRVNAFSEVGSFGSIREGGQVTGAKGPVDFSIALSRWDYTGFSATDYRIGAFERDGYRNWTGSARAGVNLPHDGRFDFNFRWMNGSVNLDNISTPAQDVFGSKQKDQQFIFSGSYEQPLTSWWSQKLTMSRGQEALRFDPGTLQYNTQTGAYTVPFGSGTISDIRVLSNRIEWQNNFQVAKPLLLTAGYQFREQQGNNNSGLDNKILSSNAGFGQAQLNLWDRVFATAGVRYDAYNVFGNATTYRLTGGYLHQETGTKIRGSYATGFRVPSMNELFFPNFGNPTLGPEKSQSYDVGVDQDVFGKRLRLSVGYFWNHYRDLIATTFDPVVCAPFSPFGFCPINIGSARTQGVEAGIKYHIVDNVPGIKNLDLQGQYTYTQARNLDTATALPRWPYNQAGATLSYQPIDPMRLNLEYRYVGARFNTTNNRQNIRAFSVFNLVGSYDVMKQVQAYVRVENLFNEKYEEILNAGTPGRSIYGGIRVNYDIPLLSKS